MGVGPQTVNNTYVNATMTIQQMNIQNMPPYMNHGHGPPSMMNPPNMMGGMNQMGPNYEGQMPSNQW